MSSAGSLPLERHARIVVSAPWVLGILVGASVATRAALAFDRSAHRYFPDEYLYGQLARSLAHGEGLSVLGVPTGFTAFLQPLLTAPFWLLDDPELAFRLTQLFNAALMSLAAIVVFGIARELRISSAWAVGCAGMAVVSPGLLYSGYVTADALGYVLALVAVLCAVRLIAHPTFVRQAMVVGVALLATTARVQYIVLVPVALTAGLLVDRGDLRQATRRYWLLLVTVIAGILVIPAGGTRALGPYVSLFDGPTTGLAPWVAWSGFLLVLASGVLIVPAAVAWMSAAVRQRAECDRATASFAWLVALLLGALAVLSAAVATQTDSERFFERYLLVVVPLIFVAGVAGLTSPRPSLLAVAVSIATVLTLALTPVSAFSASQGRADSPFLLAVSSLEDMVGVGSAALAVALACTVSVAIGLLASRGLVRPVYVFVGSLVVLAAVSVGAHHADLRLSSNVLAASFAGDPGWVDRQRLSNVVLVQAPGSDAADAMGLVLRNSSITAATRLGRVAREVDGTGAPLVARPDGTLLLLGRPANGSLLVTSRTTRVMFDVQPIAATAATDLYEPSAERRLVALVTGLDRTGAMASAGRIVTYRGAGSGCLRITLETTGGRTAFVRYSHGPVVHRVRVPARRPPVTVTLPALVGRTVFDFVAVGTGIHAEAAIGACTSR